MRCIWLGVLTSFAAACGQTAGPTGTVTTGTPGGTYGYYCFTPDTPVDTPNGVRPIGSIRAGDQVWSVDPRTGARAQRAVERVIRGPGGAGVDLRVEGQLLQTTSEHPFWVDGRGWIAAGELVAGMELLAVDEGGARPVPLIAAEPVERRGPVVTLSVEGPEHTFVAGGVLVHNKTYATPGAWVSAVHLAEGLGPVTVELGTLASWTLGETEVAEQFLAGPSWTGAAIVRDGTGAEILSVPVALPQYGAMELILLQGTAGPELAAVENPGAPSGNVLAHGLRVVHAAPGAPEIELRLDSVVPPGGAAMAPLDYLDRGVGTDDPAVLSVDHLPADGSPELVVSPSLEGLGSWIYAVDRAPVDGRVDSAWQRSTDGSPAVLLP